MGDVNKATCALWWWSVMRLHISLFTTEEAAALYAIELERSESGSFDGIQFKDGRLFKCEKWPFYLQLTAGEEVSTFNPGASRTAKSPFNDKDVSSKGVYPDWVGVQ